MNFGGCGMREYGTSYIVLLEYLLCAMHALYQEFFLNRILPNLPNVDRYCYFHFTDQETDAQRGQQIHP